VTLMILDHGFAQQMETLFWNDLERATPVDQAAFNRRSLFEHVKEWGANQITRVL
jgi:phosphatidylserine/phosphatidylglycerophosphate/cardiolipin synthase-like enzyme